ncbi:MAG: hypothetical protein QOI60_189 [Actinomycetota bacterium]|nr:hypothetical protein [Actinomycetota bacterium]
MTRLRPTATILAVSSRRSLALLSFAVLVLASCTSSASTSEGTPSDTVTAASKPGAVTDLRIDQPKVWSADPSKWQAVIRWSAPETAPDHYEVVRNDKTIAKDVTGTSYVDTTAEPATHYRYRVEAVDASGVSGPPMNAATKTGTPPLSGARLDGKFLAVLSLTSSTLSGMGSGGERWVFGARCGSGPCDVSFSRGSSSTGTLKQTGANYAGTMSIPFHIGNCSGAAVNESVTIRLTVSDAAVVHGEWRATHITGTTHEYLSYSGCVPASADYSVKGSVQT